MPGFIVVAFAGLLMQQTQPHPSSLLPYQPPTIRPFEAPATLGQEPAQGDAETDVHRRPLAAPVEVDHYARSYEFSPTDADAAYDQGVASAELRADQSAGPLDGRWRLTDAEGRVLFDVALRDDGAGLPAEGAYQAPGAGAAGLLIAGETPGVWTLGEATLSLTQAADGWRGTLTGHGRTTAVRLVRP